MASFEREYAVPGVEYVLELDKRGALARDRRLDENLHRLQLYNALLKGGDHVLWPPSGTRHPVSGAALRDNSYLDRLPAESITLRNGVQTDTFAERVNRSAHEPIAEEVIGVYVNWLFRQEIDRGPVFSALGPEIVQNIDLLGNDAVSFLMNVYRLGLTLGALGVLTDMPTVEDAQVPSRAHELAMGIRPYCRIVTPMRIWQWERDEMTGEFLWALIREAPGRFRLWTAETTTTIAVAKSGPNEGLPEAAETRTHGLGRVPLDMFIAREPDDDDECAHFGVSAIASSALLQLQFDQHASLSDDLQRKTNFPFLHVDDTKAPTVPEEIDAEQTIGADYVFYYPGQVGWVAPPAVCAQEARAHMDRLESRIYKIQGVHRRSQDSVEAHSGLALDYESSPIYATVQAWARRLHAFEMRLWRTIAEMAKVDLPEDGVAYPADFTTRPIDLDIAQGKAICDTFGGYASCPGWVKEAVQIKMRRALGRDVGYMPEAKDVLDPAKAEDFEDQEPEPMQSPPPGAEDMLPDEDDAEDDDAPVE